MPFESGFHLKLPSTTLNSQPHPTTRLQVGSYRDPVRDCMKFLSVYPHQVVPRLRPSAFEGLAHGCAGEPSLEMLGREAEVHPWHVGSKEIVVREQSEEGKERGRDYIHPPWRSRGRHLRPPSY